jgi:dienelactone hydrolase
MVQIESEDGSQVLDALGKMDQADPDGRFTGHLDTKRAGVLGYSLGGSVAAQTALHDPRFLAVMNLDGWMFGDVATQFFSQPYLVISDALAPPTAADLNSPDAFLRNFSSLRARDAKQQTAQLQKSGGYRLTVAGSSHFSFSDRAAGHANRGRFGSRFLRKISSRPRRPPARAAPNRSARRQAGDLSPGPVTCHGSRCLRDLRQPVRYD